MRIGVNALYLIPGGVGGTEIYLRALLAALAAIDPANQYTIFINQETDSALVPAAPNFAVSRQSVRATSRPARILHEQLRLPLSGIDVLFNPGFTAPVFTRVPQVTVIHDLQHKRHPGHFRWFDLPAWRLLVWAAVHRSTRLIAVSDSTRADLLRHYRIPAGKIATISHGVDPRFFSLARRPEPIVLCVSTLHPHKNIERLVRVFTRFHAQHPDYRLVLAGMRGFHTAAIEAEIAASAASGFITITGWIPREELYSWFTRASIFIYPSTFEGFGMPVIEALAAGIPTACSGIEPLRSIAGDAAWTFPPDDEDAMLAALERLARGDLPPQPGPERAAQFTWERAARETLAQLERAARSA
ncbi:MAG: glycosyltransferase family 4 protein [Acidobacteria bacterium]|nr:glycosyltransferase family 4 protein [Acidobacteriota bacterium]